MSGSKIELHTWPLELQLVAPFSTGGTQTAGFGTDEALLRDRNGIPIVAGSHLLGHFRHFLESVRKAEIEKNIAVEKQLVPDAMFKRWFGLEGRQIIRSDDDTDQNATASLNTERGLLTISDLRLEDGPGLEATNRDRIRIDPQRGSVKEGAWLVSEQIAPTGTICTFGNLDTASITLFATEAEANYFDAAFVLFAESLVAIGGNKGAGFGWLNKSGGHGLELGRRSVVQFKPAQIEHCTRDAPLKIQFMLDGLLLIEPEIGSGNLQITSYDITGGALKAALAEAGQLLIEDFDNKHGSALSKMTIRHALADFGRTGDRRPCCPVSLAFAETDDYEVLVDAFGASAEALRFQVDFKSKHWDKLQSHFPSADSAPEYTRVSRTRTAIAPGHYTAKPSQLFNYQLIDGSGFKQVRPHWITEITFCDLNKEELQSASAILGLLQSGCVRIGKMRARIVVTSFQNDEFAQPIQSSSDFRLKLATDALLLAEKDIESLRAGKSLSSIYQDKFQRMLGPFGAAIDWARFDHLAEHRWIGGAKVMRFIDYEEAYFPYLITKAGSVFRLPILPDARSEDLEELTNTLSKWMKTGLPAQPGLGDWKSCPFTPENGYGELIVSNSDWMISNLGLAV